MSLQEGGITDYINFNPEEDPTIQTRKILSDVLDLLNQRPDYVESNVDVAVETCKDLVMSIPQSLPLVTPLMAVSTFFESCVREPLVEVAADFAGDPAGNVLGDISKGIYHVSNALAEADGAMKNGVVDQVMLSLMKESARLNPEERSEYISSNRGFRTFLTNRRFGLYLNDQTGGRLVWQEFDDAVDLSKGVSPYKGYRVNGKPISPVGVEGANFVLNAYGVIFRCAREKLGEGLVVKP